MKSVFRQVQTLFPGLHNVRFDLKFWQMRLNGQPHEPDFAALADFEFSTQEVALDVGANRGEAHWSMRLFLPQGMEIHSFEPNPLVAKLLQDRVEGWPRARVHSYGLGATADERSLYVPYYRKWMFDGLASFDPKEAGSWLQSRLWGYRSRLFRMEAVSCRQEMLDALEFPAGIIKLDVQGWEHEVLKGGWQTIKKHLPVLMIEDLPRVLIPQLEALDYDLWYWERGIWKSGRSDINTFAVPKHRWKQGKAPF